MNKTGKYSNIHWLPEEEYKKAVGQLRLNIGAILDRTFRMHGMEVYVPGATDAIINLAEKFALRCRGVDSPIQTDYKEPY